MHQWVTTGEVNHGRCSCDASTCPKSRAAVAVVLISTRRVHQLGSCASVLIAHCSLSFLVLYLSNSPLDARCTTGERKICCLLAVPIEGMHLRLLFDPELNTRIEAARRIVYLPPRVGQASDIGSLELYFDRTDLKVR